MKAIYWRPQTTSPGVLFFIGLASVTGLAGLLAGRPAPHPGSASAEVAAARLAEECFHAIKLKREALGHKIDLRFDPHATGMIGEPISDATSKVANLSAKQVSVNPNFARAVVHMLVEAGVQPGDTVAVGWTGSFPALNVAVCAALDVMQVQPVAIASAMSSQYGANSEDLLWIDMEQHLTEIGLLNVHSAAMTVGGAADRAFGRSQIVAPVVTRAQQRTGIPWLAATKLAESIDERMELYRRASSAGRIAAYVNVGGGIASMGGSEATPSLPPGLTRRFHSVRQLPDCVARRFAEAGTPVIHLGQVRALARAYGLNTDVERQVSAAAVSSPLRRPPSKLLAALLLAAILGSLHAFVSRGYGYRALNAVRRRLQAKTPAKNLRVFDASTTSQLMA